LFGTPPFCRFVAASDIEVLAVPGAEMRNTPITRWKLMETHNRRMTLISTPRQEGPAFPWLPDYAIGVPIMDREHQRLLDLASLTAERSAEEDPARCLSALDDFISYTIQHFSHEEDMLAAMNYRGLADHHRLHQQLISDIEKLRQDAKILGSLPLEAFRAYVHTKMLSHIFREDSRYVRAITSAAEYIL
jgi:hemerythrin